MWFALDDSFFDISIKNIKLKLGLIPKSQRSDLKFIVYFGLVL
jgi:hypothetical protein